MGENVEEEGRYKHKVISPYCPGAIATFLFLKTMNKEDTEIQQIIR
jgi:hypothetical protein